MLTIFTHDAGHYMQAGVKRNGKIIHEWHLSTYASNRKRLREFMRRASAKTLADLRARDKT